MEEQVATQTALHLVIVSGASGSGRTQALKCLEDLGFFCVDNLPPALFPKFTELCTQSSQELRHIALGIDIRERGFLADVFANLDHLKACGHSIEILFLEASDEVLTRRFSESRRPHPLLPQQPVLEGIRLERQYLQDLRDRADRILDTSTLTVHELRDWLFRHYGDVEHPRVMRVSLMTFGFKYGVPYDADLVFDVRFLQNPNFVPELKPLTGEDQAVQAYVFASEEAKLLLDHFRAFFAFLFPLFARERRSYLTVAIGCTGGRHRSVAIALRLHEMCRQLGYEASIRHRDIHRG
ncbi:MAG: RNase adapter RapZ [Nitrospirae bacterium]|nr:MAG: RNase adapter RapZ [Nitrospirota bacterium]